MGDVLTEDLSDVTTADMVAEVKRELALRERVYARADSTQVQQRNAVQMRRMRAVLKALLERQQGEGLI